MLETITEKPFNPTGCPIADARRGPCLRLTPPAPPPGWIQYTSHNSYVQVRVWGRSDCPTLIDVPMVGPSDPMLMSLVNRLKDKYTDTELVDIARLAADDAARYEAEADWSNRDAFLSEDDARWIGKDDPSYQH